MKKVFRLTWLILIGSMYLLPLHSQVLDLDQANTNDTDEEVTKYGFSFDNNNSNSWPNTYILGDYIHFSFKSGPTFYNLDLIGIKISGEIYGRIIHNLYLGGGISGQFFLVYKQEKNQLAITHIPVEINAKYVFKLAPFLSVDLGIGNAFVSAIDADSLDTSYYYGIHIPVNLNFRYQNFIVGSYFKYQKLVNHNSPNIIGIGIQFGGTF